MAQQTTQVKNAIAKMKAAGFKRNEYTCRVERKYITIKERGYPTRRGLEYGNAKISLRIRDSVALNRIRALVNAGLKVHLLCSNRHTHVTITDQPGRTGNLTISTLDAKRHAFIHITL